MNSRIAHLDKQCKEYQSDIKVMIGRDLGKNHEIFFHGLFSCRGELYLFEFDFVFELSKVNTHLLVLIVLLIIPKNHKSRVIVIETAIIEYLTLFAFYHHHIRTAPGEINGCNAS